MAKERKMVLGRTARALAIVMTAGCTVDAPTATRSGASQPSPSTAVGPSECRLGARLPRPTLTSISPGSGAPGTTISLYGTNLNPPCALVSPKVVFKGSSIAGQVITTAQVVSNTHLKVALPPSRGSVQLTVQTAGGNTASRSFTFRSPRVASISPQSAVRGTRVTIRGSDFGQRVLSSGFVKFGDSQVVPESWSDTEIVARAPSDFGTGVNGDLLLSLTFCPLQVSGLPSLAKWIIKTSLPSCKEALAALIAKYRFSQGKGLLSRRVDLSVTTSAGRSNTVPFTFTVQLETN